MLKEEQKLKIFSHLDYIGIDCPEDFVGLMKSPSLNREKTDFENNSVKVAITKENCIITQEAFDLFEKKANKILIDGDIRCTEDETNTILQWYGDFHTAFKSSHVDIADTEFNKELLKNMIGLVEVPDGFKAFVEEEINLFNDDDYENIVEMDLEEIFPTDDTETEYEELEDIDDTDIV